jgi:hypothetical protein
MKILAKHPDLKISWNVFSALTAVNLNELIPTKYFPTFDLSIFDNNNVLIGEFKNLDNKKETTLTIIEEFNLPKNLSGGLNLGRKLNINKNKKKVLQNYYQYNFIDNVNKYKNNNSKLGFYSNLTFKVKFNSEEPSYLDFEIEYPKIEINNLNNIFSKVYRSSDLYSAKFLIDTNIFNELNIYSFLIFPKFEDRYLTCSFVENVESNWLNSINDLKLLTVPFEDVGIIEEYKNLKIEIFPLTKLQSEIFKELKNLGTQEEIYNLFTEKYNNQKLKYDIFTKDNTTFFNGNIYLFNNLNYEDLSWPKTEKNINGVLYKNIFPISNYLNNKTILAEKSIQLPNDLTVSIPDVDLGYYYNNDYYSIEKDILYFSHNNIIKLEILNVEKINNNIKIYIEVLTNFTNTENIHAFSNKLTIEAKYGKVLNDKICTAILFSYEYSEDELINFSVDNNIPIKDIIYKEIPLEISIKSV